jgi:hypothetical protein
VVNYVLKAIQETLLTSMVTAKEVSARAEILHTAQLIADRWQNVSTKTIQNCFAPVVLNTQMWRCCYETFNGTSDLDGFFRLMM